MLHGFPAAADLHLPRWHAHGATDRASSHRKARLVSQSVSFGIRPRDLWGRSGRLKRRRLCRLRRAEDSRDRTLRCRRPSRHETEDRELSRLPARHQRSGARRAGARAGLPLRCGNPAAPDGCPRRVPRRTRHRLSRRRHQDHCAGLGLRDRRRISAAEPAERGSAAWRRRLLRRRGKRGLAWQQRACDPGGRRQLFRPSLAASCPLRREGDHRHARRLPQANVSEYLVHRIQTTPNIEVLPNTEVAALHGDERLHAVTLRNRKTGEERIVEATSLFLCLGGVPNTQWAAEVGIVRDEEGYLVTGPDLGRGGTLPANWTLNREPYYLETSMPGVFAAGDVRHSSIKRLASAVGEGAMVVAFVHRYLAAG